MQDGIKAGLTVLLLDVLFVVVAIGAAFKWFEEWKWRHTRQELATALLVSAVQVSHSTKQLVVRNDLDRSSSSFLLNDYFHDQLDQIRTALDNINAQIAVHLNALTPELTRDLSILSAKIAGFNHTITLLASDPIRVGKNFPSHEGEVPGHMVVSAETIGCTSDQLDSLLRSDKSYFLCVYFAKYCRYAVRHGHDIADHVLDHVAEHHKINKLPERWETSAEDWKDRLTSNRDVLKEYDDSLGQTGLALATKYVPPWGE